MRTGVYRIVNKKSAKDFHIIGTMNIEKYFAEYDLSKYEYKLLRETLKQELPYYTEHFKKRFGEVSTTILDEKEPEVKEPVKVIKRATRKKK